MDFGAELLRVFKWVGLTVIVMSIPIVIYGLVMRYRWRQPRLSASWWRTERRKLDRREP